MSFRYALFLSYVEKYGSYAIGLASTMVISRLLGPADVGVFAVGMAVVGIIAVVREFGVSTYVVQEDDLSLPRIGAAFAVALLFGLALATVVLITSVPAGDFFGDSRVSSVIAVLALSFAITPFGSISQALLSRELRFGTLTWIRLVYSAVMAVAACGLVAAGFGPVSLAWATVVAASSNALISFAARPHSLRLNLHSAELKRVLGVGGPTTVIAIVDDIISSAPELLLGRTQGLAAAGLLSRGRGLSQMAHQLIARAAGPVFFAVFSAHRRDGIPTASLYIKATASITAVSWILLGGLIVLAEPVIFVLYGGGWIQVVPLLRWLCLAAAVALLTSGAQQLLLASGGARDVMLAKIGSLPAHLICLILGAFFGAEALAAGTVISSALSALLLSLAVRRRLGIGLLTQLSAGKLSLPIALAGMVGAAPSLLMHPTSIDQSIGVVCVGAGGCVGLSVLLLMQTSHPLRDEVRGLVGRLKHKAS